jgi:hypothetical protein
MLLVASALVVAGACSSDPGVQSGAICGGGRCGPPPKKVGHSLSNSELCTCRACEPASCCQDEQMDESDAGCPMDSYDFAASEACGLAVPSCASRCFEHRWRADVALGCEATKPARCCF